MIDSNAIRGFLPSTHGLHFANRFPSGPTVRLGPIDLRWFGVGDAASGLCGGMAWYVRERFEAGLPVPPDTETPPNGSPFFQALVRRQVQSLEWLRTPLRFWLAGTLAPTARRSRETEWPRIRARVDAGRLAMVGLVRHHGVNPLGLTRSHQVLAYAYGVEGERVGLRVYDPNWPDRDDVAIVIEPNLIRQSTGETLYGILSLD